MRKTLAAAVLAVASAASLTSCVSASTTGGVADPATSHSAKPTGGGSQLTVSQQNAVEAAQSYLSMSGFSRDGLVEQLSSKAGDGYPKHDAEVAVDSLDVNWNKQAARTAQSYLEMSSFSRSALIDQLVFEGYTHAQAVYGVNQTGL